MLKQTRGQGSHTHFSAVKTRSNSLSGYWNTVKSIFQSSSSTLPPTPSLPPSTITGDAYTIENDHMEATADYPEIGDFKPNLSVVRSIDLIQCTTLIYSCLADTLWQFDFSITSELAPRRGIGMYPPITLPLLQAYLIPLAHSSMLYSKKSHLDGLSFLLRALGLFITEYPSRRNFVHN